jgi:hypothetical protein
MSSYTYDVALSFAGEDRDFARSIALALEDAGYSVFYDEFETARLWGTELSVSLADVYGAASRYCMVMISRHYAAKPWTNHERRFAIQRATHEHTPPVPDRAQLSGVDEHVDGGVMQGKRRRRVLPGVELFYRFTHAAAASVAR